MSTRLKAAERNLQLAQSHLEKMRELLQQAQNRVNTAERSERTARNDLLDVREAWGLDEYGNDPAAAPNDAQAG